MAMSQPIYNTIEQRDGWLPAAIRPTEAAAATAPVSSTVLTTIVYHEREMFTSANKLKHYNSSGASRVTATATTTVNDMFLLYSKDHGNPAFYSFASSSEKQRESIARAERSREE